MLGGASLECAYVMLHTLTVRECELEDVRVVFVGLEVV